MSTEFDLPPRRKTAADKAAEAAEREGLDGEWVPVPPALRERPPKRVLKDVTAVQFEPDGEWVLVPPALREDR